LNNEKTPERPGVFVLIGRATGNIKPLLCTLHKNPYIYIYIANRLLGRSVVKFS